MFLEGLSKRRDDRHGLQHASGAFLLLMYPESEEKAPIRGLVRHVSLSQTGHFMMGALLIRIQKVTYRVPLSGAYGSDGLICEVPRPVYELGAQLPDELRKQWNEGGGWNSAGSEAPAMNTWALTLKFPASTYGVDRPQRRRQL